MKKTLAATLALSMLTTTALASSNSYPIGSSSLVTPNSDVYATIDDFRSGSTASLTSEHFTIYKKSFSKGSALVQQVTFDDDEETVVVELKQNMELGEPKTPNLVISDLSVKAKKETGDVKRGEILSIKNTRLSVGNTVTKHDIADGSITFVDGMNEVDDTGNSSYADATYSVGDLSIDGRVYDGDEIFVDGTEKPNVDILKAYPDADLRFVSIDTNGLPTSYNTYLSADEDEYVYKVENGRIVSSGLKWSDDDYAYTGKLRTSTQYVISDVELKVSANTDTDDTITDSENPDTGANDVVGVAAALAVVSLVAAGAVSLKK